MVKPAGSVFLKLVAFALLLQWGGANKPNFVIILTDDQDITLGGMTPMQKAQSLIGDMGVTFNNAFVTTPVCCPSRTSIISGLYQHNHRTVNNTEEGNCFGERWREEVEPYAFPTVLNSDGYRTFYAGKYLNMYGYTSEGVTHVPPGWDWWIGLAGNSQYYNYSLSVNGTEVKHGDSEEDYLTDLITSYSLDFLRQSDILSSGFMMMLCPPSAHAPFTPSKKYTDYFRNVTAMKTQNFNLPVGEDKHWLLRMSPSVLPESTLEILDAHYRNRWETLLSVDDLIESVIMELESLGVLDNTYIIYTSDHGFHIGQFAMPWDKRQPYEFDIRIPLLVRGPGVPKGQIISDPVLNIDIAPTVIDIANLSSLVELDGKSFKESLAGQNTTGREFVIEYVGEGSDLTVDEECPLVLDNKLMYCSVDGSCKCQDSRNNTYSCLRRISAAENILYCQFDDDEAFKEAYDINADPDQLNNLAYQLSADVVSEYESTLQYMSTCAGAACNSPPKQ
ncbi:N-acetylglucosamine-6-sulfatase-like [Schistocerca piceifrons]|uniref:N-acetylglucosamine-6-sulfatase-like n=1 Tax=Schistocerca piceifrons TaxID=274613 RepID=UPI001F5EE379|nr:N-acetylglucosamine-6-sulfatase-like [Schistocerca piceifrons]